MTDYAHGDALVDTAWLEEHQNDSDLAIVECDEDITAYEKGHIPNAISIDWANELHDAPRREFVSREQLEELFGKKGISSDQTIVLYSGNNNWFAAYAYWLFKYRGVEDVKLLNGGRKKWELESKLLVQDAPNRSATNYSLGAEKADLRIFREEVIDRAKKGDQAWVDVRSPEEFRGELLAPPHLPAGAGSGTGSHPQRQQHHLVEDRERRRHLQDGRRAHEALRGRGDHLRQRGRRVLPDRRALVALVVRAEGVARLRERP